MLLFTFLYKYGLKRKGMLTQRIVVPESRIPRGKRFFMLCSITYIVRF